MRLGLNWIFASARSAGSSQDNFHSSSSSSSKAITDASSIPEVQPKGGSVLRNLWQTFQNSYEFSKKTDEFVHKVQPNMEKAIILGSTTAFAVTGAIFGTAAGAVAGFGVGAVPGGGLGALAGAAAGFVLGSVVAVSLRIVTSIIIPFIMGSGHFLGSIACQVGNSAMDKIYSVFCANNAIKEINNFKSNEYQIQSSNINYKTNNQRLAELIEKINSRTLKDPHVRSALGSALNSERTNSSDSSESKYPFCCWLKKEPLGAVMYFLEKNQGVGNVGLLEDTFIFPGGVSEENFFALVDSSNIKLNHHQAAEVIDSINGIDNHFSNEVSLKFIYKLFPRRNFDDYICNYISKINNNDNLSTLSNNLSKIVSDEDFRSDSKSNTNEMGRIPLAIFNKIKDMGSIKTKEEYKDFCEKVKKLFSNNENVKRINDSGGFVERIPSQVN